MQSLDVAFAHLDLFGYSVEGLPFEVLLHEDTSVDLLVADAYSLEDFSPDCDSLIYHCVVEVNQFRDAVELVRVVGRLDNISGDALSRLGDSLPLV